METDDKQGRRPTINDVARAAGVSTVSVSRVINQRPSVRERTRIAVNQAMKELGYVPNAAAQALRTSRSNIIGCVVTDLANIPNALIVQAAEQRLNQQGQLLITCCSDFDVAREARLIAHLQNRGVDGLILQPSDEENPELHRQIQTSAVPIVIIDRDVPVATDRVIVQHYDAMRQAVRYLVGLGHREIAIIASERSTRPCRERLRAYHDELAAQGLSTRPELVRPGSHLTRHGFDTTHDLMALERPPTAIIAAGNHIMFGAVKALRSLGLGMPNDISLIGADEAELSELVDPPLTVINRDMSALGHSAAELLMRRLTSDAEAPPQISHLNSWIVLRNSCAPYAPAR